MTTKPLKRILCVDDEADMRMLIKMSLEKLGGYDVVLCPSGADALKMAEEMQPDLILLDVVMPPPDGIAVITALKNSEKLKSIPVLFMTGRSDNEDSTLLMETGAEGLVPKPFDPVALPENIATIWESITHD